MKKELPWVAILFLLMVCGCTGCENRGAGEQEIVDNKLILISNIWKSQEVYTVDGKTWDTLRIAEIDGVQDRLRVSVFETPTSLMVRDSGNVVYEGNVTRLTTTVNLNLEVYTLRVTMNSEAEVVMSLTSAEGDQMFYSPTEI